MPSVDFRTVGQGPGLLVLPGGSRRAHHYTAFAASLAGDFTVHTVDRRGRGTGPPMDVNYSLQTEVADALEVLDETGAEQIFGHSYGGLIGLHVALRRDLDRLVVFEPAVSLAGGFDLGWLDEYDALLAKGRGATAYARFLSRMEFLPRTPIATPLLYLMLHLRRDGREMRELLSTVTTELRQVAALDSDGSRYASVTTPTLLLGGGRSPRYLQDVVPALAAIMPQAKAVIIPECDHNGPDISGPEKVAAVIRA
jgi:pimeloyl-ACP methyl ester carboxylesterase